MAARNIPWISPDEFLDQEAVSDTKHSYYAGMVVAMAGGSLAHWALASNLVVALHAGLRGRGCRVGGSDLMFQTGSGTIFTYPDVTVICGAAQTVPGRPHVITNPIFVAEVLSRSTQALDRTVKLREYRASASVRQYALLSQEEPWVEIHTRDDAGFWRITEVAGLDGECAFSEINCVVPMAELYEGVLDIQPVE